MQVYSQAEHARNPPDFRKKMCAGSSGYFYQGGGQSLRLVKFILNIDRKSAVPSKTLGKIKYFRASVHHGALRNLKSRIYITI